VHFSIYTISSNSYCRLSSCCSSALAATLFNALQCLRDNVVRLILNYWVTAQYKNNAPGLCDLIVLIVALIMSILVEL
jgi:hypothetical protein